MFDTGGDGGCEMALDGGTSLTPKNKKSRVTNRSYDCDILM